MESWSVPNIPELDRSIVYEAATKRLSDLKALEPVFTRFL